MNQPLHSNPLNPNQDPCVALDEAIAKSLDVYYASPVANSQREMPKNRGTVVTHSATDECSSAALPPTTSDQPATEQFATGAKRGTDHADCHLHLIPPEAMYAYGRAFAEGAKKYGLHNWLKGFPFSGLVNHALHHLMKILEGDTSEDHIGHCLWNIGSLAHFMKHRPDLNDLPPYNSQRVEYVSIEQEDSREIMEMLTDYFKKKGDVHAQFAVPKETIGPDLRDIAPNTPADPLCVFTDGLEYDNGAVNILNDTRIHFTPRDMQFAMMPESPLLDSLAPPSGPHWEVKDDEDKIMSRVRWSEPNDEGEYLWTAHYPFELRHLAELTARNWNKIGRKPNEWDHYVGPRQNARVAADPKLPPDGF